MRTFTNIFIFALFFLSISKHALSQEFYDDGSMVLKEISTDKDYGREPSSKISIKVGTVANEYAYLKSLQGPNGEKIETSRVGSCCAFKCETAIFGSGLLDQWEITYEGLSKPITLYLNGYEFDDPKCPQGLTFKKGTITPVREYPADSIVKVTACARNMYAVPDFLLREKLGDHPYPKTYPKFNGGLKKLKKYFAENALTDIRAAKYVFRVSIAFVVTCDGDPGNYVIVSKGRGQLADYANQVLGIVNKMPKTWLPARFEGQPVDCYQVLSFTVKGGKLTDVTYED